MCKSPKMDLSQPVLFEMPEEIDTELHGECWTHNLPEFPDFRSEFPNADGVCSLSDILVIGFVPLK
ncbi:MAG: hypothetical protein J6T08_01535, partial [Lentisphaeria bacterium]|nr:hypothetical protein [Lentisphaeria bacterium]